MEEKEEDKKIDSEELKKETVDTVNQVKDTIKNVDIKNDAKEATGFISAMFKDPFGKIQEMATDTKNRNLKIAIILIVVWVAAIFIRALWIKSWSWRLIFGNVLSITKIIIAPIISILVLSGIVYIMNKKDKKPLATIITTLTAAKIPVIMAGIANLLLIFSSSISKLTTPFSAFCTILTTILTYFAIKALMGKEEQNSKFLKTFVIIEAIYYMAYLIISFLEIYI